MRSLIFILVFTSVALGFDFSAVDTSNANWLATEASVADIRVHLRSEVKNLFGRDDLFPFRYVGPKTTTSASGRKQTNFIGGKRIYTSFDASGNKGWIYIKEISDRGAHVRCVVREPKDDGKILYEKEFLIPWSTKKFVLDTATEHFNAQIDISPKK